MPNGQLRFLRAKIFACDSNMVSRLWFGESPWIFSQLQACPWSQRNFYSRLGVVCIFVFLHEEVLLLWNIDKLFNVLVVDNCAISGKTTCLTPAQTCALQETLSPTHPTSQIGQKKHTIFFCLIRVQEEPQSQQSKRPRRKRKCWAIECTVKPMSYQNFFQGSFCFPKKFLVSKENTFIKKRKIKSLKIHPQKNLSSPFEENLKSGKKSVATWSTGWRIPCFPGIDKQRQIWHSCQLPEVQTSWTEKKKCAVAMDKCAFAQTFKVPSQTVTKTLYWKQKQNYHLQ